MQWYKMTVRLHAPRRERPRLKDYSALHGAQLPNMHTCLWYIRKKALNSCSVYK